MALATDRSFLFAIRRRSWFYGFSHQSGVLCSLSCSNTVEKKIRRLGAGQPPSKKGPVPSSRNSIRSPIQVGDSTSQYVPTYPGSTGRCSLHETSSFLFVPSRLSGKPALVVTASRKLRDPGPDRPVPAKFNLGRAVAHEIRNRRRGERRRKCERSRRERRAALVALASGGTHGLSTHGLIRTARRRTSSFGSGKRRLSE